MGCEHDDLEIALEAVNPNNYDYLLQRASTAPLEVAVACQNALGTLEATFEKPLNQLLTVGYGIAFKLQSSPPDLEKFLAHESWPALRPKVSTKVEVLRLVFRFIKKAWRRGAAYDTACRYTVALAHYFENGIAPTKIPAFIKQNGGIEALYRTEVSIRRENSKSRSGRRLPHRNSAVPKARNGTIRFDRTHSDTDDLTREEEALILLLEKFYGQVVDFIRHRHEQEEADWSVELFINNNVSITQ